MPQQDHTDREQRGASEPSIRFRLGMVALGIFVGALIAPAEAEPVGEALKDTVKVVVVGE